MTLEITAIPLAFLAGMLSILSPCVWPLVPVVLASAGTSGRRAALFLALGLSTAFALAGTLAVFFLLSVGLAPDLLRYVGAALLAAVALTLLIPPIGDWLTRTLSRLTSVVPVRTTGARAYGGQFGVGALLGLVWLPCVGPTLGAAIALASMGQALFKAFLVMFAFGLGTAAVLIAAAYGSGAVLNRWRPGLLCNAAVGKRVLGWLLLVLALLVFTGVDRQLEALALQMLPEWAFSL